MIFIAIVLVVALVYFIIKRFAAQIGMLACSVPLFYLWTYFAKDTDSYVPIFAMEENLMVKIFGTQINVWLYSGEEMPSDPMSMLYIMVFFYLFIILFSNLTKWSMAAASGCAASIGFSSIIKLIDVLNKGNEFPGVVVFIATLIVTLVFMWFGFHTIKLTIMLDKEVLSLIVGSIPMLIFVFIALCNAFTMSFGTKVIGDFGYVVAAIIIDVALCGGGIFLYFKFKKKYWELMEKKLEKLEE